MRRLWPLLTGDEGDLAEQNPFHGKVQVNLHVTTDPVVQFNGDISRMLHIRVPHVIEPHRLRVEVLATDAEVHQGTVKHLRGGREWRKDLTCWFFFSVTLSRFLLSSSFRSPARPSCDSWHFQRTTHGGSTWEGRRGCNNKSRNDRKWPLIQG